MKKVALVFILAVLAPSLVLAWLAVRSLRDQELVFERQQELLYQQAAESVAENIRAFMSNKLHEFETRVDGLAASVDADALATTFDERIRAAWPLAGVGFAVTTGGAILAPAQARSGESARFLETNSVFLSNVAPAEVYRQTQQALLPGKLAATGMPKDEADALASAGLRDKAAPLPAPATAPAAEVAKLMESDAGKNAERRLGRDEKPAAATAASASFADERKQKTALAARNDEQRENTAPSAPEEAPASAGSKLRSFFLGKSTGTPVARRAEKTELAQANDKRAFDRNDTAGIREQPARTKAEPPTTSSHPSLRSGRDDRAKGDSRVDLANKPAAGAQEQIAGAPWQDASSLTSGVFPKSKKTFVRAISPQKQAEPAEAQMSSVVPAEAEFRQLVGEDVSGSIARFVDNKLSLMFWHRLPGRQEIVFGAQLRLDVLKQELAALLALDAGLRDTICLALLDDNGRPVARTHPDFSATWKRPFVATEIGEILPHWEIAAYLLDPSRLNQSAAALRRTIGLIIAVMLAAIALGGWLIVADLRRQLLLARQKTDFVSNVSHELKTPLTSIRMFSELLAEGRVDDAAKQRQYSQIISAEASRLTRLINNVLDFARIERGGKKYERKPANLGQLVSETVAAYRPHLETNGYLVECSVPGELVEAVIDRDAIQQVLLNLISNAEKYGSEAKHVSVALVCAENEARITVSDRGPGVPRGAEEKIFGQFYRAHDSLNSGIQGAGLGLTLARQIARAHGGDVLFAPREGGGSCFTLILPLAKI